MLLLLVRHAIAEDRIAFARTGAADDLRPLSGAGRKKMRPVASALRGLVPAPDLLLSSPLVRARQTADLISDAFDLAPTEVPALAPAHAAEELLRYLAQRRAARTVVAVGHEPGLSQLAAFALTGRSTALFALKKGGACLLEFASGWRSGDATLLWLLAPAHLRALAVE